MRALLFETRTGAPIRDLQVSAWETDTGILAPDVGSVTVPAYTVWGEGIGFRAELVPLKHSIAIIDDTVEGSQYVVAAGVVQPPTLVGEVDGLQSYKVPFRGVETLLQYRHIRKFPGWPLIASNGKPVTTYDMSFTNKQYGTIIKGLVAETELFPGGDLPIIYEADRTGVHERTDYKAIDGKTVLDAINDITELVDGVEYDFVPQIDVLDNITYKLVTGTDSGRAVINNDALLWNLGGARPDIIEWEPTHIINDLATDAFFTGGKEKDKVLVARASDSTLIDDGWPRIEVWDSSHSTVDRQATLQSWANGALNAGFRRFNFKAHVTKAHGVRHGDLVQVASDVHWDEPGGVTSRRVVSVARDSGDPDWVSVQLA